KETSNTRKNRSFHITWGQSISKEYEWLCEQQRKQTRNQKGLRYSLLPEQVERGKKLMRKHRLL
ncbi:hypothetical protein HN51_037964, partial [Arachis hypogaea]